MAADLLKAFDEVCPNISHFNFELCEMQNLCPVKEIEPDPQKPSFYNLKFAESQMDTHF